MHLYTGPCRHPRPDWGSLLLTIHSSLERSVLGFPLDSAARTRALGEGAAGHCARDVVLHGDGLHRGGVGQRQGLGVGGAGAGRRAAVGGVVDGGVSEAADGHQHTAGIQADGDGVERAKAAQSYTEKEGKSGMPRLPS